MNTENNKQIGRKEMLDTYVRYVRHRGDARVILRQRLDAILSAFNPGMKILVHGGGVMASQMQKSMGMVPKMVEGRRVTDED